MRVTSVITLSAAAVRLARACRRTTTGVWLACLLFLQSGNFVRGDSPLVTADVVSPSAMVRSGAPITVVWKVTSRSNSLLEGNLDLKVRDGHERLARLVSDEIVLTSGEHLFRTVLPTLDTTSPVNAIEMELQFVGPRQSIDLGVHNNLRLPSPWQRACVVAISDPWQTSLTPEKHAFLESFRFESYSSDPADRTVTTGTAHIHPDTMPTDPLGYLGFDIVLLINEGFADLKDAQLQALLSWVDAGGSLAVVPGRQVVRNEHLAFLNKLAGRAPAGPLTLDPSGRLSAADQDPTVPPSPGLARIVCQRYGLGRAAIVRDQLEALAVGSQTDQRRMLGFLWKLRLDQLVTFESTGKWNAFIGTAAASGAADDPNQSPQAIYDAIAQIRPREMQLAPLALQTGDHLLARLMPRNLRVIPLPLIALMLLLYVLVIGPGDYWLLGALRRRRYTWILFPAVTIGFALGTVWISNWYMRVADNRRNVTFLDVGETGEIARRNRFDLLFRAAPGEAVTDMQRGLFTAMNHQQFTRGSWFNYQQAVRRGTENQLALVAIPQYAGRVPARYTVSQFLPQWTPQLNRLCTLAPDESEPAVPCDWNSLAALNVAAPNNQLSPEARQRIAETVVRAFGDKASVSVVTGRLLHHIAGPAGILQRDDPQIYSDPVNPYAYPNVKTPSTFLLDVCCGAAQGGLFNVVSQLSPTGGLNFEDMALVDPSDPRQWLLIVMIDRGDELIVYRKLYTGE